MSVSASTEAYFAFSDTQWREVAVKNPKLTPKQIQASTCQVHSFTIVMCRTRYGRIGYSSMKEEQGRV